MIKVEQNQHDYAVATFLKKNEIKGGIIGYVAIEHSENQPQKNKPMHHTLKGEAVLRNTFNAKKFNAKFDFVYYVDGDNKIIIK